MSDKLILYAAMQEAADLAVNTLLDALDKLWLSMTPEERAQLDGPTQPPHGA